MPRLGDQVDVYCGRCKMERYHTVAALGQYGAIERVVCGYCQTSRKFKDPAGSPRRSAQSSGPRARASAASVSVAPSRPPRRFDVADSYAKDDFIEHLRYGIGRVTEVRGDRIDVKFTDGSVRTFVHGKR
jgi:hypothetical protein